LNFNIKLTKVDFAVTEGLRTPERQRELFAKGASQVKEGGTHVAGRAIDVVAFLGGRISWELNLYDDIADAMRLAALEANVGLRWGAAWNVAMTLGIGLALGFMAEGFTDLLGIKLEKIRHFEGH